MTSAIDDQPLIPHDEHQYWRRVFERLSVLCRDEGDLTDLSICLFDGREWGEQGKKILEEGGGTKIADVCKKLLEKFLVDKLMRNSTIQAGQYAEIREALISTKRVDLAFKLDELMKVSFESVVNAWMYPSFDLLLSPPPPPQEGSL